MCMCSLSPPLLAHLQEEPLGLHVERHVYELEGRCKGRSVAENDGRGITKRACVKSSSERH